MPRPFQLQLPFTNHTILQVEKDVRFSESKVRWTMFFLKKYMKKIFAHYVSHNLLNFILLNQVLISSL